MDDADRADKRITDTVDDGIQAARRALSNSLVPIGSCYYCESVIDAPQIFCDDSCGKDYEHERKRYKDLGL